jgi:hypothetical protein
VTSSINEMMMQSHEEVIRLFPVWVKGVDASFTNLRAYGAFTVSSAIKGDEVAFAQIESEMGTDLTIVIPWASAKVTINGAPQPAPLSGQPCRPNRATC